MPIVIAPHICSSIKDSSTLVAVAMLAVPAVDIVVVVLFVFVVVPVVVVVVMVVVAVLVVSLLVPTEIRFVITLIQECIIRHKTAYFHLSFLS